jgi:hypothetical protein
MKEIKGNRKVSIGTQSPASPPRQGLWFGVDGGLPSPLIFPVTLFMAELKTNSQQNRISNFIFKTLQMTEIRLLRKGIKS